MSFSQISENFAGNLTTAMKRYEGNTVQDCAHNIIVDLSEVSGDYTKMSLKSHFFPGGAPFLHALA